MTIHDVEQRSHAWLALRLGRVNSSDAADLLATTRSGGEAAARRDLRLSVCCERLTGRVPEAGYVNAEMQRGVDCEPLALAAYEAETGAMVESVGYVTHDELMAGYSPDGFVGDFGLLEVKCPKTTTHLKYLRDSRVPPDYFPQLQHALFVTGRAWIDFVSFDDRLPDALQFFCVRLNREDAKLADYERSLRAFLAEVDTELEALQTMANHRARLIEAAAVSA